MNIIDIIICAVIGLSLVSGMHKGFFGSTLALIGFIGSWFAATRLYEYVTTAITSNTLVMTTLSSVLSAVSIFPSNIAGRVIDAMSDIEYREALNLVNIPIIGKLFENNVVSRAFESINLTTLGDYLTQTLVVSLVNVFSFVVTFAVIYFALLLIVNLLGNVFKLPALRHLDWLLGGVFGAVRGVFIIFLVAAMLPTAISILASMDVTNVSAMIEESNLAGFFMANNFLTEFIEPLM